MHSFLKGGGALYIGQVWAGSDVTIQGQWRKNSNTFQHGLGGAVKLDYVEGAWDISLNTGQDARSYRLIACRVFSSLLYALA